MSTVDELYRRYVRKYRAAGDADPRTYLDELHGIDRAELAARIDRFLDTAPPPAFDPTTFGAFRGDPTRDALVTALLRSVTLVELRAAAATTKREVGVALAKRLGLPTRAHAVRARYHDLEVGTVDPRRVAPRVWDALSVILAAPTETLREAAELAFSRPAGPAGPSVLARAEPPGGRVPSHAATVAQDTDDTEVDRLFFGDHRPAVS